MPDFDEDAGGLIGADDDGDDGNEIEVEVNETEPLFLKGQTRATVNLSPVKIVKNPDGSLQVIGLSALRSMFPNLFGSARLTCNSLSQKSVASFETSSRCSISKLHLVISAGSGRTLSRRAVNACLPVNSRICTPSTL
jgi:hypothetical protein